MTVKLAEGEYVARGIKMVAGYKCYLIMSANGEQLAKAHDEQSIRRIFAEFGGNSADAIQPPENGEKLTALNLPKDPNEAAAETLMRQAGILAKMRKKLFDEHMAAGFTEAQALQLCVK